MKLPAFTCGLVENPQRYAPDVVAANGWAAASKAAAVLIGAGFGCDALDHDERRRGVARVAVRQINRDTADRAAAIWCK